MSDKIKGKPVSFVAAIAASLFALAFASAASAAVTGDNPCPASNSNSLPWMGNSIGTDVRVPSVGHAKGTLTYPGTDVADYPGTILRPADTAAYPGPRPVVVFQHGNGGNRCGLWWAAQFLAGHGYVTSVHTSLPPGGDNTRSFISATDATRSAITYLESGQAEQEQPELNGMVDGSRLGASGHSLGSVVVSLLQGDKGLGIKAIVAFDTLRRYVSGDPGGAKGECAKAATAEVVPTVPALSFAMDEPCEARPDFLPADLKLTGPRWWTTHGLPNMQLVMRGYPHGGFTDGASADRKHDLSHYVQAWFERWLRDDISQDATLLSRTVNGKNTLDLLSTQFQSSACLAGLVDTEQFGTWIASDPVAPTPAGSGSCDDPIPDPVPAANLSRLNLNGHHRLRAGRWTNLKLRITNSGDAFATGIRVQARSSNRRVVVRRQMNVDRIAPRWTRTVRLRVRAMPKARGRARITVTVANQRTAFTIGIRRQKHR